VRPIFSVHEPEASRETPLLVEVPHAGLDVPPELSSSLLATARSIARDADLYVDELYQDAVAEGATLIVSHVSRYVVDLNRGEGDVDSESVVGARANPKAPRGLIWRLSTDVEPCLRAPLSALELGARLDIVYRPYHAKVLEVLQRKRQKFSHAILLAAHSMPSAGRTAHGDAGHIRTDVVPGTQGRTTAMSKVIDAVDAHARNAKLSVKHDEPYRGGFSTRNYGRPRESMHAVQVELARRLYMDEGSLIRKAGAFETTRAWCRELCAQLGARTLV
jgi:N-formylglutamate deformylase